MVFLDYNDFMKVRQGNPIRSLHNWLYLRIINIMPEKGEMTEMQLVL